jgi:peptide/nickel transport system substrate-binding protein
METTYKLKPNLVWHDGTALTADDFVFSWKLFTSAAMGTANVQPVSSMEEVVAADPSTLTIRWKRTYPPAGTLTDQFAPTPRHLLEAALQTATTPDALEAHPFWTQQFVGAGPFRLDRWEPGAFIEGTGFDRHVLGAPKISRVRLLFMSDPNTVLASMLAGEVHLSADDSIRFQQGATLQREWGPNGGSILIKPSLWRSTFVQFVPEFLGTPGLADVRVRKALALTMDKDGINQALFEGQAIIADVPFIPKTMNYYPALDPVVTKYPFDPNRAQQLLTQAGYARAADGVWASPTAGRLSMGLMTTSGSQNEAELSILGSGWRQVGFEINESVMSAALAQDGRARTVFPGLSTISIPLGEETLAAHGTAGGSREENRYTGRNRGNWSNAEFDRASDMFNATLDPKRRVAAITEMVRIFSEELPTISMYFNPVPFAHVAALTGPRLVAPDSDIAWNVQEWEVR